LGSARSIQSVEIRWPAGTTQVFTNLALNSTYHIREGNNGAEAKPLRTFQLSTNAVAHSSLHLNHPPAPRPLVP
jgi:hypothetical protein